MKMRMKPAAAEMLVWSYPDPVHLPIYSGCFCHIPKNEIPMVIWSITGKHAQLCDYCAKEAFEVVTT